MTISASIYAKLAADGAVTALLGTYAAAPCIFSGSLAPGDAPRPYVQWNGAISAGHADKLAGNAASRDEAIQINCIADETGSAIPVDAIAEAVRASLHRQPLTIAGADHVQTICISGPVATPTDDSLIGRSLTFRVVRNQE